MAKSFEQIQRQIEVLQREAESARKREIGKVVERIRIAIRHYQLTPKDLFGSGAGRRKAVTAAKRGNGRGRRTVSRIKYRDDAGHSWTGHGRRPQWFLDAIASGKKPEDLAV